MKQSGVVFNRQYPQSFLIKTPLWGTVSFVIILYFFVVIYQPLSIHATQTLSFSFTMLFYCLLVSAGVLSISLLIKKTNCFSKNKTWTVSKELSSIVIVLACIGVSAYFAGFIMESQDSRWNLATFLDSFSRSVLIGLIPVLLPSLLNIRFAFTPEIFREYQIKKQEDHEKNSSGLIHIKSRAKKEELSFFPNEFIYAESDGNYVVFHLIRKEKPVEATIRNSISEIERQLIVVPYFMRTHRAFILNLEKVISNKGNSLGYQLKLKGSNNIVPVSRQNILKFDELARRFLLSAHH